MKTDANPQRVRLGECRLGQCPLDVDRARNRSRHLLERDHETVSLGLDDLAPIRLDLAPDDVVVHLQKLEPGLVAQRPG